MDITLRTAQMADIDAITAIESMCFPAAEGADYQVLRERLRVFGDSFIVAVAGNRIVGFVNGSIVDQLTISDDMFLSTDKHDPHGDYQAIFGLDVIPAMQHQHIAGKLMKELMRRAREQHRKGLILTCKEKLIPMYEHLGYTCRGISASTHGNAIWYDMDLLF